MTTIRKLLLALAVAAAAPGAARAADVAYEGVLVPGLLSAGTVGGYSWFLDDGAGVDYWRFLITGPAQVRLRVDRLNGNLDPALSLYQGQTTASTALFNSLGSWGGLSFVGSLDDEAPPFVTPAGPNGDPLGSFTLTAPGWYTVVVGGANSTDSGVYAYQVALTVTPVPEPRASLLLAAGVAVLVAARRRWRGPKG